MTLTASPRDIDDGDLAFLKGVLQAPAPAAPSFTRALTGFFGSTALMIALLVFVGTLS
jgi:hypothetical protein